MTTLTPNDAKEPPSISGYCAKALSTLLVIVTAFGINILVTTDSFAQTLSAPVVEESYHAEHDHEEILWLARAIYSESKRTSEQVYVAWVIKNRKLSAKYPDTYKEVVLQKNQFSGLNPHDAQYHINTTLTYSDVGPGWDSALSVAELLYDAGDEMRVLHPSVMHFYSPISVRKDPSWAVGIDPAHEIRSHEGVRFAFYADIK